MFHPFFHLPPRCLQHKVAYNNNKLLVIKQLVDILYSQAVMVSDSMTNIENCLFFCYHLFENKGKEGIKMKIDLHIHTNISDGSLSPKEVIDEAWKNGVSVISITDHDIIDSYTPELFSYAKSKNVKLISGVEISTKNEKAGIHVLGYNFDLNNKEFSEALYKVRNARHEYLHNVAKKLNELGYFVNVEKLDKIDAVTKAHITLDIVESQLPIT